MKNTIIIMLTALLWISCSDDEKVNIKPVAAFKTSEVTIRRRTTCSLYRLVF